MDDREVGKLWEGNAEAWTRLTGLDIAPTFLRHAQDAQVVPYFLHVRVRKPAESPRST